MTDQNRASPQLNPITLNTLEESASDGDQQILRIQRIAKRLFGVANCLITFGDAVWRAPESDAPIEAVEQAFCHSIPAPRNIVVAGDTAIDKALHVHPLVHGAPFIRFYAGCPIHNGDNKVVGGISLIDYAPRIFSEEDRNLLVDLSHLVEREMHVRSLSATQLDLERKNKTLRRKSLIDPLIGTWNRGAIMRILTIEAVRCDKMGLPLSLIVADLDHFKKVNDTYGHPAGDAVLVKVASRLRSCIRAQEALGRYGGEEFLIVLPGSSHSTAVAVAERMRLAIASQPELVGETILNLTISAGVASTELFPTATTEDLISFADIALYNAKDAGRNRVCPALPK